MIFITSTIRNHLTLCLLVLISAVSFGQQVERVMYPVFDGSDELRFGFAGGVEAPQLSKVDLNRDGVDDILLFDRAGDTEIPLIYKGPAGDVNYDVEWEWVDGFPDVTLWAQLRDFNGDGIEDLFASTLEPGVQGVDVYRGRIADNKLHFDRMTFDLGSFDVLYIEVGGNFSPMYSAWTDVPAIEDVDGDGDLDILTFEPGGSFLAYYQNISLEQGLGLDTLLYDWADPCWGKFRENDLNEEVFLSEDPDRCATGSGAPLKPRHSGSAETVFDIDGDGDMDLLLGDLGSQNIKLLINGGDAEKAFVTEQVTKYPRSSTSVDLPFFVTPKVMDIDGDGLEDFLAACNTDNFSENVEVLWYYRNRGSEGDPDFRLERRDLFVNEMLDFGTSARPAIMDVNGDGLMDIIVGTGGYYDEGLRDPRLILLQNTGTAESPAFEIADDDFLGFSAFGSVFQWDFAPVAGDLDGDGDRDLLVGEFDGGLFYVENIAESGEPAGWANPIYPFMDIYVGAASTPDIYDINGDGLNDLVIGERLGNNDMSGKCSNLNYFQNIGSTGQPEFDSDVDAPPNNKCFGRVLFSGQVASPEFSAPDIINTNEGVFAVVGSEDGKMRMYSNVAGNVDGAFDLEIEAFGEITDGFRTVPAFEDIDNDGLYEVIIGNFRGGLTAFETDIEKLSTSTEVVDKLSDSPYTLFPNPSSDHIVIGGLTDEQVVIFDNVGRQVSAARNGNYIDISRLAPGVYTLHILGEKQGNSQRFVKIGS